jgi:hypothetical protein
MKVVFVKIAAHISLAEANIFIDRFASENHLDIVFIQQELPTLSECRQQSADNGKYQQQQPVQTTGIQRYAIWDRDLALPASADIPQITRFGQIIKNTFEGFPSPTILQLGDHHGALAAMCSLAGGLVHVINPGSSEHFTSNTKSLSNVMVDEVDDEERFLSNCESHEAHAIVLARPAPNIACLLDNANPIHHAVVAVGRDASNWLSAHLPPGSPTQPFENDILVATIAIQPVEATT